MQSDEIRKKFLAFFEKRGHAIIPSASLVPETDSSVLFTTAGMQPLAPYLLGETHPLGRRLANVQKCVRTQDIDEVGDNTHDTFFEMLGNWSLGDYFKDEAIQWSYELLTSKSEGFGLDPNRLYITVFEGNENAPQDHDSFEIWKNIGVSEDRIYFMDARSNWWSAGESGPCGPDTEMFYDITEEGLGDMSKEEFIRADDEQKVVEIWNDVFMEYEMADGKVVGKLKNRNVDTGAGLERLAMVLQNKVNIFDTDLFESIVKVIKANSSETDTKSERIVADHIRTAVFMITDGVTPSNTERGYILRRLLRRAVRHADKLQIKNQDGTFNSLVEVVAKKYTEIYPEINEAKEKIIEEINKEESKFKETLKDGIKEFEKLESVSGAEAFMLFSTYGFPFELTHELAHERGIEVSKAEFDEEFKKHQESSRSASVGKFKGGLGDHSESTVKLHTAHHLLLSALQNVLGNEVKQRGSNINQERLRIDFSFDRKLTDDELKKVEELVNQRIKEDFKVVRREMSKEEAEKLGAEMEFGARYPNIVSVYFIENEDGEVFSKEFCGGPHVKKTSELGQFKILKEESVASGVRRIKAILL